MDYDTGNTNVQAEKKARGAHTASERITAQVSVLPKEREGFSLSHPAGSFPPPPAAHEGFHRDTVVSGDAPCLVSLAGLEESPW